MIHKERRPWTWQGLFVQTPHFENIDQEMESVLATSCLEAHVLPKWLLRWLIYNFSNFYLSWKLTFLKMSNFTRLFWFLKWLDWLLKCGFLKKLFIMNAPLCSWTSLHPFLELLVCAQQQKRQKVTKRFSTAQRYILNKWLLKKSTRFFCVREFYDRLTSVNYLRHEI